MSESKTDKAKRKRIVRMLAVKSAKDKFEELFRPQPYHLREQFDSLFKAALEEAYEQGRVHQEDL